MDSDSHVMFILEKVNYASETSICASILQSLYLTHDLGNRLCQIIRETEQVQEPEQSYTTHQLSNYLCCCYSCLEIEIQIHILRRGNTNAAEHSRFMIFYQSQHYQHSFHKINNEIIIISTSPSLTRAQDAVKEILWKY